MIAAFAIVALAVTLLAVIAVVQVLTYASLWRIEELLQYIARRRDDDDGPPDDDPEPLAKPNPRLAVIARSAA